MDCNSLNVIHQDTQTVSINRAFQSKKVEKRCGNVSFATRWRWIHVLNIICFTLPCPQATLKG